MGVCIFECRHCRWHKTIHLDTNCSTQPHSRLVTRTQDDTHHKNTLDDTRVSPLEMTQNNGIITPLPPCFVNNAAFVSLIPAVLVQDRFVSTSTVIDTIIVAHVLVTLSSVYLNRWRTKLVICVSHSQGTLMMTQTTLFVSSHLIQMDTGHSHSH